MAITAREMPKAKVEPVADGKYRLDLKAAHQTYRLADGTKVPGVTTVLNATLPKDGLKYWAWQCGQDGIDIDKARDHAADTGTVCHARIEAWLRGLEFDTWNISPEQMELSEIGLGRFVKWWTAQDLKLHSCETQMVSEVLRAGGTSDIVATRPSGTTLLMDIKTSNGIYLEHRIQVATYAAMWAETRLGFEPDEAWIIRVGKDDADEIEPVQVMKRKELVTVFTHLAAAFHALKAAK